MSLRLAPRFAVRLEPCGGRHAGELAEVTVEGLFAREACVGSYRREFAGGAVPVVLHDEHLGVFHPQTVHVVGE